MYIRKLHISLLSMKSCTGNLEYGIPYFLPISQTNVFTKLYLKVQTWCEIKKLYPFFSKKTHAHPYPLALFFAS